jgi:hypothetical protein
MTGDNDRPAQVDPEHRVSDSVVDLGLVRGDDAFVEQLAAGLVAGRAVARSAKDTEDRLIAMLSAWVAEVRPESVVETDWQRAEGAGLQNNSPDGTARREPR